MESLYDCRDHYLDVNPISYINELDAQELDEREKNNLKDAPAIPIEDSFSSSKTDEDYLSYLERLFNDDSEYTEDIFSRETSLENYSASNSSDDEIKARELTESDYLVRPIRYTPQGFKILCDMNNSIDLNQGGIELSQRQPSNLPESGQAISPSRVTTQEVVLFSKQRPENLVQDSINRINQLNVLYQGETFETSDGTYLNGKVTLLQINEFLEPYLVKLDYGGVSISMRTNKIYGETFPNSCFTAIYLKNNEKSGSWEELGARFHRESPSTVFH